MATSATLETTRILRALLVIYDNDGYLPYFPMGLGYIATALEEVGVDVEIWNQDVHHYPDEDLAFIIEQGNYDMVGLSVCGGWYQYKKLTALSKVVNNTRCRGNFRFIIGGHMPVSDPKYFLAHTQADLVIMGEGETTIQQLALSNFDFDDCTKGVAWLKHGKLIVGPRSPLLLPEELDKTPAYHLFPMEVYRLVRMPNCEKTDFVMPMLAGRGCWGVCNFCFRIDKGIRARLSEHILEEMRHLAYVYGINYFSFGDELLMSSIKRTNELCDVFIRAQEDGFKFKWDCNGRLNFAKPEVLSKMKQAGCVFINYGIEAFDDQVLKNMNKSLTCAQIVSGIEATLEAGISPGYNIIWGNIGDNAETLQKGVDLLLKYDDGAQLRTIRPVTPYSGTDLFKWCVEKGLIKDTADFYENLHKNSDLFTVDIMGIGLGESHRLLMAANKQLLDNYYKHKQQQLDKDLTNLYIKNDSSFRGWRSL